MTSLTDYIGACAIYTYRRISSQEDVNNLCVKFNPRFPRAYYYYNL
jgi:hypothetical protein